MKRKLKLKKDKENEDAGNQKEEEESKQKQLKKKKKDKNKGLEEEEVRVMIRSLAKTIRKTVIRPTAALCQPGQYPRGESELAACAAVASSPQLSAQRLPRAF